MMGNILLNSTVLLIRYSTSQIVSVHYESREFERKGVVIIAWIIRVQNHTVVTSFLSFCMIPTISVLHEIWNTTAVNYLMCVYLQYIPSSKCADWNWEFRGYTCTYIVELSNMGVWKLLVFCHYIIYSLHFFLTRYLIKHHFYIRKIHLRFPIGFTMLGILL